MEEVQVIDIFLDDSVQMVVDVLQESIQSIDVCTELPPRAPKKATVMIARTGGNADEFIDRPIMTIFVWGESDKKAYSLSMSVIHALSEVAQDHPYLSEAELVTMSRDEWSKTGQARYMLEVKLTINKE